MTGSRGAAVAAALATASGPLPARGAAATASVLDEPAGVAWEDGILRTSAPQAACRGRPSVGSPDRGLLVPGFVDCHVHLPFIGWRADEFEARLAGASYRDLHGEEGGIFRSSRLLRAASDDEVLAFCLPLDARDGGARHDRDGAEDRLRPVGGGRAPAGAAGAGARGGRAADVLRDAARVPRRARRDVERADWVRAACDELIPAAAAEELVDQVDIYVEDIAFSLDDLAAVAAAAARAGLPAARPRRSARPERRRGGRRRARRAERRPPEPPERGRRRGARGRGRHRRGAAARVLVHPRGAGPAGRRRSGAPARRSPIGDRLQPRNVARVLDARGDRVRVHVVRAATAGGAHGGHREPGVRPGAGRPARHARGRQARRRPAAGGAVGSRRCPYRPGHDPVVATLVGGELVA